MLNLATLGSSSLYCNMLTLLFIACSSDEVDWNDLYQNQRTEFESALSALDPLTQENIRLSVLAQNPNDHRELCQNLRNSISIQTCKRYEQRPHLQTIPPAQITTWSGGKLGERLVFPRDFTPMKSELTQVELPVECVEQPLCLDTQAEKWVYEDWSKSGWVCNQHATERSKSDCFFHMAELIPVHVDKYADSAKLCAMAGGYAGECHNHLLLRYASKMWDRLDWHQQLIQRFDSMYVPAYSTELKDAYWSIVAFRVVGMDYPLNTTPYLKWPEPFQNQLHSIVALRVWEEDNPLQLMSRAMKGEVLRVPKARGPGAPRFNPRSIWTVQQDAMQWQRFCDIRGGYRPTHDNPQIDMVWAYLTATAMADPPDLSNWTSILQSEGQMHWEIRWAMAVLLQNVDPSHIILTQLKSDSDIRVKQMAL